jgi:hypothetical protein
MDTYESAENERRFEVVCKTAMKLGVIRAQRKPLHDRKDGKCVNLLKIATDDFSLNFQQYQHALYRARKFLEQVTRADRVRVGGLKNLRLAA